MRSALLTQQNHTNTFRRIHENSSYVRQPGSKQYLQIHLVSKIKYFQGVLKSISHSIKDNFPNILLVPRGMTVKEITSSYYSPAVGGTCLGEEAGKLGYWSDLSQLLMNSCPAGQATQHCMLQFAQLPPRCNNTHLPQRNPKVGPIALLLKPVVPFNNCYY